MAAFEAAVQIGAHALETDIHLSRDGVVVLSHDKDLKRCFGVQDKIIDCDWHKLSQLRTIREPRQSMPRLRDLLEYLAAPGREHVWLLLDIKTDNDPEEVMRLIAETLASVPAGASPSGIEQEDEDGLLDNSSIEKRGSSPARPTPTWHSRVVLGVWSDKYLPLCSQHLPGFSIAYIGFNTLFANRFFAAPNISFNMLYHSLMGPLGFYFRRRARRESRPVFAWTVNDEKHMLWCIRRGIDGVISDDPKRFLELCADVERERVEVRGEDRSGMAVIEEEEKGGPEDSWTLKEWYIFLRVAVLAFLFGIFWCVRSPIGVARRFREPVRHGQPKQQPRSRTRLSRR